jgi:hypothetical protein
MKKKYIMYISTPLVHVRPQIPETVASKALWESKEHPISYKSVLLCFSWAWVLFPCFASSSPKHFCLPTSHHHCFSWHHYLLVSTWVSFFEGFMLWSVAKWRRTPLLTLSLFCIRRPAYTGMSCSKLVKQLFWL